MYTKQKINEISLLLSKGLTEIYRYVQDHKEFWEFERDGKAIEYINSLKYLDDSSKKSLCAFYSVGSEISEKYMESHMLVLTSRISEREHYSHAVNTGIVAVKEFLDYQLVEDNIPNRLKILELVNGHIKVIRENIDDLSFFLSDKSITDESLEREFDNENSIFISYEVLRRIDPNPVTGFLRIYDYDLKNSVTKYMFRELAMELKMEYGDREAREIYSNFEKRMEYLMSEPDVEHLSNVALMIGQLPTDELNQEEVYLLMWRLGTKYIKCRLQEADIEAAIKLYEYLIQNFWIIQISNYFKKSEERDNFIAMIYTDLSKLYSWVWEREKAIEYRKKGAILTQNSKKFSLESILFDLIDTLTLTGREYELPDFLFSLLENPRETLGFTKPIELSKEVRTLIEIQLATLIQELDLSPKKRKEYEAKVLKFDNTKIVKLFTNILKGNEIKSDELSALIHSFREDMKGVSDYLELSNYDDIESEFESLCENWRMLDPDTKKLEEVLSNIESSVPNFKYNKNVLRFKLFAAKLKFHKGDELCIDLYKKYIKSPSELFNNYANDLQDYFDSTETRYWYREYLRAISLNIDDNQELEREVSEITKKWLNNSIVEYYENIRQPNALFFMQNEVDECIRCLRLCLNNSHQNHFLFQVLWSVFNFKKEVIYWKAEQSNTFNKPKFEEKLVKLKKNLAKNYFEKAKNTDDINEVTFELNKLLLPEFKNKSYFKLMNLPQKISIFYHIFHPQDDEQELLIAIYYPDANDCTKFGSFDISSNYRFNELRSIIENKKSGIRWRKDGFTTLVQEDNTQIRNYIYNLLFSPTYRNNKSLLSILNSLNSDPKPENNDIYLDGLLYHIPIEFLHNNDIEPFGITNNLSLVINRSMEEIYVNRNREVLIISDVDNLAGYKKLKSTNEDINVIREVCTSNDMKFSALLSDEATVENLVAKLNENKRVSVLYFSMHGISLDSLTYDTASLLLQPVNNELHTSLLTYHDVRLLDLSGVDLVVLSGCFTAIGEIQKNSPMQGLAYAFLSAGAKCVVASRLEVREESTTIFMKTFFDFIINHQESIQNSFRLSLKKHYQLKDLNLRDLASWSIYT
jgi:hypothetical protein